jgi:hypothetical protein
MANEYALPAEPEFERLFNDIYPGLHDWVLQDIIEWVRYIYERVQQFFNYYWSQFLNLLSNIRTWILEQATNAIQSWWYGIQFTFFWIRDTVYNIWNRVATIATEVYLQVSQALQGVVYQITSHIGPFFSQLWTNLSTWFSQVWTWISTHASQLAQTVWGWIQETWSRISIFFGDLWARIADWFCSLWQKIVELWGDVSQWFKNLWDKITDIPGLVLAGIADIGESIWGKVIDWLEKDIKDAIDDMEGAESIEEVVKGSPFWALLAVWAARLLPLIWIALKTWAPRLALFGGIIALEQTGKLEDLVEKYVTPAFTSILDHFESLGPMAPQPGGDIAIPLTKVLTTTITGLSTFVLAGGVMGLFKQMGLGVVSAMLYDLTNFRTLTAAFMTSLAAVYIAEPVKYYYQSLARPYLPQLGHALSMAGEYALVPQAKLGPGAVSLDQLDDINEENRRQFLDIVKYHGFSDEWGGKLYELADSPAKYFAMRAMADSGFWDEGYYISELLNSGYNIWTIKNMVDMFRRFSLGEVKGIMLPVAMTRFREGFSDEEDLKIELESLGLPEPKIPLYVFAANLSYQTDYASDLLAAYKTQYNKGMINEADFRGLLRGLGVKPERIEGYVLRESAKKFKAPKETKVPEEVPRYLTDEGQVRINTLKEAFRDGIATAEELYAGLVELQMPLELAEAVTEYEIVKKAPKAPE